MKPSTRILLVGLVIQAVLGGIAWYLLDAMAKGDLTPSGSVEEATTTILTVMGGAMGVLAAITVVLFLRARSTGH